MVALAGQLSGWPVPLYAGILTPVSVTTNQSVRTPVVTPI
ncbi:ash family protein [Enterobacter hormaechei subsp. hoffmannii]|nr:ash family protein [Enterobacter hormaechei subsp. hoffmannii]